MAKLTKFNSETGTAVITDKQFIKHIPEDAFTGKSVKEVFTKVDELRGDILTTVGNEVIDYAEKVGVGDGNGSGVSVEIHMGGNTTGNIFIDPCFKMVYEVKTELKGELIESILARSGTLFEKHNITAPDADD